MIKLWFRRRDVTLGKSKRELHTIIAMGKRKLKDLTEDDTKMIESQ